MSENEKLIEEAEQRYPDIEANPETFPTGWSRKQERNAFIAGAVFEKALTPTDDERAIFDAIADRLGEHSQARNFEIADSGEYETKLRGPVDVEVLAEWLLPTVLGFCRSEARHD